MKILRKAELDTAELKLGDQIILDCGKYGDRKTTCHRVIGDGQYLFVFDDYLFTSNRNNAYGAMERFFESELHDEKKSFIKGGLRLLTYGEVFGHDNYYKDFEPDSDEQLPLMAERGNRVAYLNNELEWGWLQNRSVVSAATFAVVTYGGIAVNRSASFAFGVRPAFEMILDL